MVLHLAMDRKAPKGLHLDLGRAWERWPSLLLFLALLFAALRLA